MVSLAYEINNFSYWTTHSTDLSYDAVRCLRDFEHIPLLQYVVDFSLYVDAMVRIFQTDILFSRLQIIEFLSFCVLRRNTYSLAPTLFSNLGS
jgi:hypothetical protein